VTIMDLVTTLTNRPVFKDGDFDLLKFDEYVEEVKNGKEDNK